MKRKPKDMPDFLNKVKHAGETFIPEIIAVRDEKGISDTLYQLIIERGSHLKSGNLEKSKKPIR